MRVAHVPIAALLLSAPFVGAAAELPVERLRDGDKEWSYTRHEVHGWTLMVQKGLSGGEGIEGELLAVFDEKLGEIADLIPAPALGVLRQTKFWFSDEPGYPLRSSEKSVMTYHVSAVWLKDNGLNPFMEGGVHMVNPHHYLHTDRKLDYAPMTVLHELSHSYADKALGEYSGGDDAARLKRGYDAAMGRGLYAEVPSRSDPKRMARAYAAVNQREYFAELTEAYFGRNDWFPRTREELEAYDPGGAELVRSLWGLPAKAAAPARAVEAVSLQGLEPLEY